MFSFTRCISTPWIFTVSGLSAVYDLYTRSMYPLQSWGSFRGSFDVSEVFRGGYGVVSKFSQSLPRELALFLYHPTYSGVYAFFSRSDILGDLGFWSRRRVFDRPTALLAALLPGSWSSQSFSWFLGFSEVLIQTASRLQANPLELCFLSSVVIVFRWRIFFSGCLPSLRRDF